MAIYDEFSGRLDDALKKYQDISASTMNPKYNADISRVQAQIGEEMKLSQAMALRNNDRQGVASRSLPQHEHAHALRGAAKHHSSSRKSEK